jgi:hypothetical protein
MSIAKTLGLLGLLVLMAVCLTSLSGVAGAQPTLTSSFFEAECVISRDNQLSSCPGDPSEFLPDTKCYPCSIGDGKAGDCLAYCDGENGGSCHCEVEEACENQGSVTSGGGCEQHSSGGGGDHGSSLAQLTETAPSQHGWECSWTNKRSDGEGGSSSLTVDAYVSCVGLNGAP